MVDHVHAPAATTRDTRHGQRGELALFFIGTFGLTWGIAAVLLVAPNAVETLTGRPFDTTHPIYFVAVYAPTIIAITLTALRAGWSGLRELAGRVVRWRVHPLNYVLILVGLPVLDMVARVVQMVLSDDRMTAGDQPLWSVLLNGTPPTPMTHWYLAPFLLVSTLVLDAGPVGEEIGWKGYALPRFLALRSPLIGALLFGLVWGVWHLPAFLISGTAQRDLQLGAGYLIIGTVCFSLIMTWFYRRTGGSVLVSGILIHLMINSAGARLWAYDIVLAVPALAAAVSLYRTGRGRRTAGPS